MDSMTMSAAKQEVCDQGLERILQEFRPNADHAATRWSRSRLLLAMTNEAVIALQEGVASAADIDLAMMAGIGYPKKKEGPLHFADELGIDQVLHELEDFAGTLGPRFWPAPMLRRMVDAGFTGRMAGRGFHVLRVSPQEHKETCHDLDDRCHAQLQG